MSAIRNSSIAPCRLFVEMGVLYALTLILTFGNHVFVTGTASDLVYGGVLLSLMVGPWCATRFWHERSGEESGAEIVLSGRDLLRGALVSLGLILPVFAGAYLWYCTLGGLVFSPSFSHFVHPEMPLGERVVTELLLVALPEEFFYRGYLLTTMRDALSRKFQNDRCVIWGLQKSDLVALVITSLCFGIAHTLGGEPGRIVTFFPAIMFGLLRLKSDGIVGCILLHAWCNLMMLFMHWNLISG